MTGLRHWAQSCLCFSAAFQGRHPPTFGIAAPVGATASQEKQATWRFQECASHGNFAPSRYESTLRLTTTRPIGWRNVLASNCPSLTCQSGHACIPVTTRDILRNSPCRTRVSDAAQAPLLRVLLRRLIAQKTAYQAQLPTLSPTKTWPPASETPTRVFVHVRPGHWWRTSGSRLAGLCAWCSM